MDRRLKRLRVCPSVLGSRLKMSFSQRLSYSQITAVPADATAQKHLLWERPRGCRTWGFRKNMLLTQQSGQRAVPQVTEPKPFCVGLAKDFSFWSLIEQICSCSASSIRIAFRKSGVHSDSCTQILGRLGQVSGSPSIQLGCGFWITYVLSPFKFWNLWLYFFNTNCRF